MDYAYSPSRQGGTMHLPSPTHPHHYRLDGAHFSHLQQLRRSLSRSPSKPSRFQLRSSDSTRSPISPLALARAFSPKSPQSASPVGTCPESPLPAQPLAAKKKFSLRRSAPFRSSPRTRTSNASSPRRRALADATDTVNSSPLVAQQASGQENTPVRQLSVEFFDAMDVDRRFTVNDKPIKFDFTRLPDLSPAPPVKSSPLKRNDGSMSASGEYSTSPIAKRRSLHGVSSLGHDFESIFDVPPAMRTTPEESPAPPKDKSNAFAFSSPVSTLSPPRRTSSLRRSTLSQRVSNTPRTKPSHDGEFAIPSHAAFKSRSRMSLDGSIGSRSNPSHPFRKSTSEAGRMGPPQPTLRNGPHPHPLSYAQTPSSSSPSISLGTPMAPPRASIFTARAYGDATPAASNHLFTRSLPIGIGRPQAPDAGETCHDSFGTPFNVPLSLPIAFSTGLLSKKNRNADEPAGGSGIYIMPDTPSKRQSYPPAITDRAENLDTPLVKRVGSLFGDTTLPNDSTGIPSTPFSTGVSKFSTDTFDKRPSIFGDAENSLPRRGSLFSVDGDGEDDAQPENQSPTADRMIDSHSSADDMPPTPTKPSGTSSRRSKESSLRRKTFRQRPSLGTDTFAAPTVNDGSNASENLLSDLSSNTAIESFAPIDASRLSLSDNRRDLNPFNSSFSSFPPATPTASRDSGFFSSVQGAIPIGLTKNDVDESLSARFHDIKLLDGGEGEFSQVYRVSKPAKPSPERSPAGSQVWVVKKSKKPYLGAGDRARKMREADILYALQGNEHVLRIQTHWEFESHLYIQTEYCEGGNLRKYLDTVGFNSRLDDFRIWKILLELLMGLEFIHDSGYIHLDLKPANILIDFEGGLKIADFGLASSWPAPKHIDGEGDRHYLAPEALSGRFDKPADVFALGMMLAEIAGNCVIPENGVYWQKLRSGDFENVLPSLTWSADSSTLSRDSNGDPIPESTRLSMDGFLMSDTDLECLSSLAVRPPSSPEQELAQAPKFMVERHDPNSMDHVVHAMLNRDPDQRPTAEKVLQCFGCQWVDSRRRSGATIYEGNFGPGEEVLSTHNIDQHNTVDAADMMDMS